MTRPRAALAGLAVALALACAPRGAAADDAFDRARALYDQGVAAFKEKHYGEAAALFAAADALAPDPIALDAALDAAIRADDPVLGMTLVERAARTPAEGSLARAVAAARDKFAARVGRVRVACADCTARLDGAPLQPGAAVVVATGDHAVELSSGGRVERRTVRLAPGQTLEIAPAAAPAAAIPPASPAPAPPPSMASDAASSRTLSPAWFFAGAGLTAIAGAFTIASGVDTLSQHDAFVAAPTEQASADGQAAETRTYVLGGVTGAIGLATIAMAAFAVEWSGRPSAAQRAAPAWRPGAGPAGLRWRF